MYESLPDSDAILAQFNRLIQELQRDTLKRYQKAVQRHMEKGARLPLKLSEYLEAVKMKRPAESQPVAS